MASVPETSTPPLPEDPDTGSKRPADTAAEPEAAPVKKKMKCEIPKNRRLDVTRMHCSRCRFTFTSDRSLRSHLMTGVCISKLEGGIAPCQIQHEHQSVRGIFATMQEGLDWIEAQELDQYFCVRNSRLGQRFYACISSNKRSIMAEAPVDGRLRKTKNVSNPRQRKSNPRKYIPCNAYINLKKVIRCFCPEESPAIQDKSITIRDRRLCPSFAECYLLSGCLTHDHVLQPNKQSVKLSAVTKGYILNLLEQGLEPMDIAARINKEAKAAAEGDASHVREITSTMVRQLGKRAALKKEWEKEKALKQQNEVETSTAVASIQQHSMEVTISCEEQEIPAEPTVPLEEPPEQKYPTSQENNQNMADNGATVTNNATVDNSEAIAAELARDAARMIRRLNQVCAFLQSGNAAPEEKRRVIDHLRPSISTLALPSLLHIKPSMGTRNMKKYRKNRAEETEG